jgi:hypothetical protein
MNPYGTVIEGEIRQGFGAASRVVPRLAPHLKPYFSAIDDLHPATINVFLLYKALTIRVPDIVTPPLEWKQGQPERFALTKIRFEFPRDSSPLEAWILTPDRSPHRFNASTVEILTTKLLGVEPGEKCRVHTNRDVYW